MPTPLTDLLRRALLGGAVCIVASSAGCERGPTPCMSPGQCSAGQECLANRCVAVGADPVPPNSTRREAYPRSIALLREHTDPHAEGLGGAIVLGSRRSGDTLLLLRFDVDGSLLHGLHSAFLVLTPSAGAPSSPADVPVEVWRISEDWRAADVSWLHAPALAPPTVRGIARSSPPSVLRIDVTDVLRRSGTHSGYGIAVRAAEGDAHGASFHSGFQGGSPPRLDLYYR